MPRSRKYPWLDGSRMGIEGGSYGGQLTNWIITQTRSVQGGDSDRGHLEPRHAELPAYYHDYLAVEFGALPARESGRSSGSTLWERSAIRYANKVKTPMMFVHGENDNDVPIAEAEQFYIALRDVGVETVMLRYPREGHGMRETKHVVDVIERSIAWYERHFGAADTRRTN